MKIKLAFFSDIHLFDDFFPVSRMCLKKNHSTSENQIAGLSSLAAPVIMVAGVGSESAGTCAVLR